MIEFRTLGSLELLGPDGREHSAVLTQPKRVALLTYLAASTPHRLHRRDTLLGLFWPELDQEHARAALRQALHGLRQGLGTDVITSRGDEEVGVDEERLRCDARAFQRELDAENWSGALELYRGGLLEGFFLSGAPEFERWLEEQRARLRDRACQAAWMLAHRARSLGDSPLAAQWARRAASLLPDDEEMVRRLIALLDELGDRAGAMQVYEEFAGRVASDYEVEPAAETKALVARVKSREAASASATLIHTAALDHWATSPATAGTLHPPAFTSVEPVFPPSRIPWRRWIGVGGGLVLIGTVLAIGHRSHVEPGRPRKQVDPVTYDLYIRGHYLIPRRTPASLARSVALLSQSIDRDSTFASSWADMALALHYAIRLRFLLPHIPRDSLLQRELWASDRAVELDTADVDAWLTRALVSEDLDPTSRAPALHAIRKALALDSLSALAWHRLALALEEVGDRSGAGHAWRRAVALDPGQVEALAFLALHYWWWRVNDSAAVWADSAVATDPTYLLGRVTAGQIALGRGRRGEAESQLSAARPLAFGPTNAGLSGLVDIAIAAGDTVGARQLLQRAEARTDSSNPDAHAAVNIAAGYAVIGNVDRALLWLERYHPARDLHFQLHLRLDPPLDPLRSQPRFQAILLKVP